MQTLGERLQEARQRLGVTLREAAEFTKIRTDYLQAMEAGQFESIPLADVYKRGFVKLYAKYLRLDEEKAAADFTPHPSVMAARPPRAAGVEEPEGDGFSLPVGPSVLDRDKLVYVILVVGLVALLFWAVFG
ncbi:MAG: helix-turn-helix domain-containing protein [Opitutales bacterium]